MTYALEVLKSSLKTLEPTSDLRSTDLPISSFIQFLQEFRTIGIRLPRRAGKTYASNWLHTKTSSRLFSNYLGVRFNTEAEIMKMRGTKSNGLRYQCIILDEYSGWPVGLEEYIFNLGIASMLTSDFYVVHLYT